MIPQAPRRLSVIIVAMITVQSPVEICVSEIKAGRQREQNFRKLFERYYGIIYRFFANRGFPRPECQDLAQDVFLRLYRSIDTYRSEGPFEGWLFQLAANVYRNRLRDQKAGKRRITEDSLESFHEEAAGLSDEEGLLGLSSLNGPLEGCLEKERREILDRALQTLPEQMRRCLSLRIHQDLKYREIAAIMQISVETVKAHLYQARKRLKSELDAYFDRREEGKGDA